MISRYGALNSIFFKMMINNAVFVVLLIVKDTHANLTFCEVMVVHLTMEAHKWVLMQGLEHYHNSICG